MKVAAALVVAVAVVGMLLSFSDGVAGVKRVRARGKEDAGKLIGSSKKSAGTIHNVVNQESEAEPLDADAPETTEHFHFPEDHQGAEAEHLDAEALEKIKQSHFPSSPAEIQLPQNPVAVNSRRQKRKLGQQALSAKTLTDSKMPPAVIRNNNVDTRKKTSRHVDMLKNKKDSKRMNTVNMGERISSKTSLSSMNNESSSVGDPLNCPCGTVLRDVRDGICSGCAGIILSDLDDE